MYAGEMMPKSTDYQAVYNVKDKISDMLGARISKEEDDNLQVVRNAIWRKAKFTESQFEQLEKFFKDRNLKR
jgi:hypothetical protein